MLGVGIWGVGFGLEVTGVPQHPFFSEGPYGLWGPSAQGKRFWAHLHVEKGGVRSKKSKGSSVTTLFLPTFP